MTYVYLVYFTYTTLMSNKERKSDRMEVRLKEKITKAEQADRLKDAVENEHRQDRSLFEVTGSMFLRQE